MGLFRKKDEASTGNGTTDSLAGSSANFARSTAALNKESNVSKDRTSSSASERPEPAYKAKMRENNEAHEARQSAKKAKEDAEAAKTQAELDGAKNNLVKYVMNIISKTFGIITTFFTKLGMSFGKKPSVKERQDGLKAHLNKVDAEMSTSTVSDALKEKQATSKAIASDMDKSLLNFFKGIYATTNNQIMAKAFPDNGEALFKLKHLGITNPDACAAQLLEQFSQSPALMKLFESKTIKAAFMELFTKNLVDEVKNGFFGGENNMKERDVADKFFASLGAQKTAEEIYNSVIRLTLNKMAGPNASITDILDGERNAQGELELNVTDKNGKSTDEKSIVDEQAIAKGLLDTVSQEMAAEYAALNQHRGFGIFSTTSAKKYRQTFLAEAEVLESALAPKS